MGSMQAGALAAKLTMAGSAYPAQRPRRVAGVLASREGRPGKGSGLAHRCELHFKNLLCVCVHAHTCTRMYFHVTCTHILCNTCTPVFYVTHMHTHVLCSTCTRMYFYVAHKCFYVNFIFRPALDLQKNRGEDTESSYTMYPFHLPLPSFSVRCICYNS